MATILYLNDTQVYPEGRQAIRITRENPFFTQSEAYTLDVTLPMDILANRAFFRNLHRKESSKQPPACTCRLLVGNRTVLAGTAAVTQVTQEAVKVQLLAGKSEVNFLARENDQYIDQIGLGTVGRTSEEMVDGLNFLSSEGVRIASGITAYSDNMGRSMPLGWTHYVNLVDLLKLVIRRAGYTLTGCPFDTEPWSSIYICPMKAVSPAHKERIDTALCHWLTSEFLDEVCNFFNVTPRTDQEQRTVTLVPNGEYFAAMQTMEIKPVDEYTVDMAKDEASVRLPLPSANIEFDLSDSDAHICDCLEEDIRQDMPRLEYATYQAARAAWDAMATAERRKYVFSTPKGTYASWVTHDTWTDDDGNEHTEEQEEIFLQVDMFAPLMRDSSNKAATKLRIVPVAMRVYPYSDDYTIVGQPSLEIHGNTTAVYGTATAQKIIQDMEAEREEKEDRMQVLFITRRTATYRGRTYTETTCWTHRIRKDDDSQLQQELYPDWSLSLNPTEHAHYLGELHTRGAAFNVRARHIFKFIADTMPDPATTVFIIRGHRYACEKIEAGVSADGFDRLMTGYFYEMP